MSEPDIDSTDTEWVQDVICPWCLFVDEDGWELESGEHDCLGCDRNFHLEIDTIIYFTTTPINKEPV